MSKLKLVIEKVRVEKSIGLQDFQYLSLNNVEALTEAIAHWRMYGHGHAENFGKKHPDD